MLRRTTSDSSAKSTRQNQLTESETIALAKVSSDKTMGEASNLSRAAPRTTGRSWITSVWSVYVDAPLSRIRFARQRADKVARVSSHSGIVIAASQMKTWEIEHAVLRISPGFLHFDGIYIRRNTYYSCRCKSWLCTRPTFFIFFLFFPSFPFFLYFICRAPQTLSR